GIDLYLESAPLLVFLPAQLKDLRIIKVSISNRHVVKKMIVGGELLSYRQPSPVRDYSSDGAGVAVQRKGGGKASCTREPGGIHPIFIDGKKAMCVQPDGLCCFHFQIGRAVLCVVRSYDDVAVLFCGSFVEFDRNLAARKWIEGIDDGPAALRRVR